LAEALTPEGFGLSVLSCDLEVFHMVNKNMTIAAAISALKKEAAERLSAASILEAVTASGVSEVGVSEPAPASNDGRRRTRRKRGEGAGRVAVEIIRNAGRPLHGLTEIVPALEARGIKIRSSGLPTCIMRTGQAIRVAPGTYGLKNGTGGPSVPADTKELKVGA
jgi:hypothetical protein